MGSFINRCANIEDKKTEEIRRLYAGKTFDQLCDDRENLAFKKDEFYRLGSDPERERKLILLTDLMFERLAQETQT